jgi:cytidylate kinase
VVLISGPPGTGNITLAIRAARSGRLVSRGALLIDRRAMSDHPDLTAHQVTH